MNHEKKIEGFWGFVQYGVYKFLYIYIYTYTHTYAYVYIHICIHLHVHMCFLGFMSYGVFNF